jgi:hypothetical protein
MAMLGGRDGDRSIVGMVLEIENNRRELNRVRPRSEDHSDLLLSRWHTLAIRVRWTTVEPPSLEAGLKDKEEK